MVYFTIWALSSCLHRFVLAFSDKVSDSECVKVSILVSCKRGLGMTHQVDLVTVAHVTEAFDMP